MFVWFSMGRRTYEAEEMNKNLEEHLNITIVHIEVTSHGYYL